MIDLYRYCLSIIQSLSTAYTPCLSFDFLLNQFAHFLYICIIFVSIPDAHSQEQSDPFRALGSRESRGFVSLFDCLQVAVPWDRSLWDSFGIWVLQRSSLSAPTWPKVAAFNF